MDGLKDNSADSESGIGIGGRPKPGSGEPEPGSGEPEPGSAGDAPEAPLAATGEAPPPPGGGGGSGPGGPPAGPPVGPAGPAGPEGPPAEPPNKRPSQHDLDEERFGRKRAGIEAAEQLNNFKLEFNRLEARAHKNEALESDHITQKQRLEGLLEIADELREAKIVHEREDEYGQLVSRTNNVEEQNFISRLNSALVDAHRRTGAEVRQFVREPGPEQGRIQISKLEKRLDNILANPDDRTRARALRGLLRQAEDWVGTEYMAMEGNEHLYLLLPHQPSDEEKDDLRRFMYRFQEALYDAERDQKSRVAFDPQVKMAYEFGEEVKGLDRLASPEQQKERILELAREASEDGFLAEGGGTDERLPYSPVSKQSKWLYSDLLHELDRVKVLTELNELREEVKGLDRLAPPEQQKERILELARKASKDGFFTVGGGTDERLKYSPVIEQSKWLYSDLLQELDGVEALTELVEKRKAERAEHEAKVNELADELEAKLGADKRISPEIRQEALIDAVHKAIKGGFFEPSTDQDEVFKPSKHPRSEDLYRQVLDMFAELSREKHDDNAFQNRIDAWDDEFGAKMGEIQSLPLEQQEAKLDEVLAEAASVGFVSRGLGDGAVRGYVPIPDPETGDPQEYSEGFLEAAKEEYERIQAELGPI